MKTIVIGIAGGTGSGKTTLAHRLVEAFGRDEICMLNHDAYYKRHDDLPFEERCKLNYDHPDSFDTDLMVEHLQQLKAGQGVDMPVYDYTRHTRSDETVRVNPAPVILVEGILIFASPELCQEMDLKVYVDTDADVRILRRPRSFAKEAQYIQGDAGRRHPAAAHSHSRFRRRRSGRSETHRPGPDWRADRSDDSPCGGRWRRFYPGCRRLPPHNRIGGSGGSDHLLRAQCIPPHCRRGSRSVALAW